MSSMLVYISNGNKTILFHVRFEFPLKSTTWLPEPSSFKMFGPFSLQQEDYSEIDVKVTSVEIIDGMVKFFMHAFRKILYQFHSQTF